MEQYGRPPLATAGLLVSRRDGWTSSSIELTNNGHNGRTADGTAY